MRAPNLHIRLVSWALLFAVAGAEVSAGGGVSAREARADARTSSRSAAAAAGEVAGAREWLEATLDPTSTVHPFSFTYGGRSSRELLPEWNAELTTRPLGRRRTQHTLTWRDPSSGLVLRCVAVEYRDFPTVEWTLYFENAGTADTPILEAILPLDLHVEQDAAAEFVLHHNVGSQATQLDYAPITTPLPLGATTRLAAAGGRPTGTDLSYFNLDWGHDGLIGAIGWPGQWAVEFSRDAAGLSVRGGQELTHFRLHPGETVRTPLVVLQSWQTDWLRAQNVWRRWMVAYNLPRIGGRLPRPQLLANSSRAFREMQDADEANQTLFLDRYRTERLKIDAWWMDAGWYVQQHSWWETGTWTIDPVRFPHGFTPITRVAHRRDMKVLVWFEPERVAPGTWLADTHPEWILGGRAGGLLDLGNPDAWNWLVDHIDQLLTDNGIDIYRQDFNIDPLPLWRQHDAPDREGITEIGHVTGYLAFWDELRRRHPKLLIDSCASGGRRNDLETMRRSVPLWRSDLAYEPVSQQGMTYGLAMWLPYFGTGTVAMANPPAYGSGWTPVEPYAFWSDAAPSVVSGIDVRAQNIDYDTLRTLFRQWRRMSRFYFGDYYPLTPYTESEGTWIAWQFDRPAKRDGVVQAFRRAQAPLDTTRLKLRGLDRRTRYVIRALDGTHLLMSGRRLMEAGLPLTISEKPGATVLVYRATTSSGKHAADRLRAVSQAEREVSSPRSSADARAPEENTRTTTATAR